MPDFRHNKPMIRLLDPRNRANCDKTRTVIQNPREQVITMYARGKRLSKSTKSGNACGNCSIHYCNTDGNSLQTKSKKLCFQETKRVQ